MEPVDFTQQSQVRQVSHEVMRLRAARRALLRWIVAAPLAWLVLAILLAGMDGAASGTMPASAQALFALMASPTFTVPLSMLAWETADTLFWPLVVVVAVLLLRGLLGEFLIRRLAHAEPAAGMEPAPPDHGAQVHDASADGAARLSVLALQALSTVPMAVAAFGVIWSVMSVWAFAEGSDHWEALPWVTPPYVAAFMVRHPGLLVERGADTSGQLMLSDGRGHAIRLHGYEFAHAELSLGPCPGNLEPAQLGGITPYPGMACHTYARLRGPDGEQWFYLFGLSRGSDGPAMEAHFRRWIDQHASGSAMSSGAGHMMLSAGSTDDVWHLELQANQGGPSTLRIRQRR